LRAVTDNVADYQRHPPAAQRDGVEPVPAGLQLRAGHQVLGGQPGLREQRQCLRQQAALQGQHDLLRGLVALLCPCRTCLDGASGQHLLGDVQRAAKNPSDAAVGVPPGADGDCGEPLGVGIAGVDLDPHLAQSDRLTGVIHALDELVELLPLQPGHLPHRSPDDIRFGEEPSVGRIHGGDDQIGTLHGDKRDRRLLKDRHHRFRRADTSAELTFPISEHAKYVERFPRNVASSLPRGRMQSCRRRKYVIPWW
jgi:hypothetical protein